MADLIAGLDLVTAASRFIPALFVLIIVFAILSFTKAIGENQFVQAIVALCVAVLFLLSGKASAVIAEMVPWFVVLFVFIIFILIAFKAMGVSDSDIMSAMTNHRAIIMWVIAFSVLIGALALGNVFGQSFLEQQPGYSSYQANPDGTFTTPDGTIVDAPPATSADFHSNLTRTIFHPTILGFALLTLIATFTIYFMTK